MMNNWERDGLKYDYPFLLHYLIFYVMMTNKKVWVYDLEQFLNLHTATFMNRDDTEEVRVFAIHVARNDSKEYYKFLQTEVAGLIGFNNVNFDYPLLHFFMMVMQSYTIGRGTEEINPEMLNDLLYDETQRIINEEYSAIPEHQVKIPQLDLFRIHHFDNKAKRTSLKAVEIAMNSPNVQDMPYPPYHHVLEEEIQDVLDYNFNDVEETEHFYELSKDLIELRKNLGAKYGLNLRNANDPKIGQEIFGREIAKKKGWSYRSLRDMRTYRHSIDLNDCVLDHIKFRSDEFNRILDFFKKTTIITTYKAFEESVLYKGFKYDYGTGGIHGCIESGVYESTETHMILDIDVAAYYPSLAIVNKFYPQHLGMEFVEVYKELFDQRMIAKRDGDKVTNSGLKLALNGVYGKSNDQYSLFYDPKYTMQITINGQLQLSMLAEDLTDYVKDITILQINTDGITVMIPRTEYEMVKSLCVNWEKTTGLILEYGEYNKMVIRDVNNYLAQSVGGYAKPKGAFEIIPMQNGAIAYNKNWSMRVVPKAVHAYYLENIPIEDFVRNHDNIYDFGMSFRARPDWNIMYTYIDNSERIREKQQRTVRYYVSNTGGALTKQHKYDNRVISIEAGKPVTMFNKFVEKENYNIDYNYYIARANKIMNAVDDGQLKLF
jgi:hypothetical protein